MQTIDIAVAWAEVEERQARVDAVKRSRYLDRVPVVPGIASRLWLRRLGRTWAEYTSDPRTMLELQIQAHKWVLENVAGDLTGVPIRPDRFYFYGESYALGCELTQDDLTLWIRTHPIHDEADLRRLEAIDAGDNRCTDALLEWKEGMEQYLGGYQFRYADGVVRPLPERLSFEWGSIGVFTLAADLRGPDIYLDLYEHPEFAREFLRIVTDKVIGRYRWLRSAGADTKEGTLLVDDSAGALSPWLYREFVYPCNARVAEAIGRPLRIHIDAPADHLLPMYREMEIASLDGFGWGTSLEKVRETLGGRATMSGNLAPYLFAFGTSDDVYRAATHALEILGPCGGFTLMEGANMVPEAKLENIAAMLRAAEDFGLPALTGKQPQRGDAW